MHTQKIKISELDYYAKFVFSCEDIVYTTTDRDWLDKIETKDIETRPVQGFAIDNILVFPDRKEYRITNIKISNLYVHTTDYGLGYDGEAGGYSGTTDKERVHLFHIYIDMVKV